jgi:hypothetical protein
MPVLMLERIGRMVKISFKPKHKRTDHKPTNTHFAPPFIL